MLHKFIRITKNFLCKIWPGRFPPKGGCCGGGCCGGGCCGSCGPCCGSCGPCCGPCGPCCGPCGSCGPCGPCGSCGPFCGPCGPCGPCPCPCPCSRPPRSKCACPGPAGAFGRLWKKRLGYTIFGIGTMYMIRNDKRAQKVLIDYVPGADKVMAAVFPIWDKVWCFGQCAVMVWTDPNYKCCKKK